MPGNPSESTEINSRKRALEDDDEDKQISNESNNSTRKRQDKTSKFGELSDELLIELLHHANFPSQQKVQRVCRKWRSLFKSPELAEKVYLDYHDFEDSPSDTHLDKLLEGHKSIPKRPITYPAVCELTISKLTGDKTGSALSYDGESNLNLILVNEVFCKLKRLTLYGLRFWYYHEFGVLCGEARGDGNVELNFELNIAACNFHCDLEGDCSPNCGDLAIPKTVHLVGTTPEEITKKHDGVCWPYPTNQVVWLLNCVVRLKGNKRWVDFVKGPLLDKYNEDIESEKVLAFERSGTKSDEETVEELFRPRRETWSRVAAFILQLDIPDLEKPPHKFLFQEPSAVINVQKKESCRFSHEN